MLKVFATDAVISQGYDGAAALRYSENGESVRFRFGKRVYDSRAEDKYRWVNFTVKAFGPVCERVKKMQLKEGSYVNLSGRLDEDTWTDKTSGQVKSATVIILDEIEYVYGGGQKSKETASPAQQAPAADPTSSENFTGYEAFGGNSFFDEG